MKTRRKPVQREKHEQSAIVQLLRSIGAKVCIIGTKRPGGKKCPKCGTFVAEHQGTCQTPGIPDLYAFLPARWTKAGVETIAWDDLRTCAIPASTLWVEVKAEGGRVSVSQQEFEALALKAGVNHVIGDIGRVMVWLIDHGYLKPQQVPHYRLKAFNSDPATAATRQAPAPKVRADLAG